MNKKIMSSVLTMLIILGSTSISAFATMDNGTVVIGSKSFELAYANDPENSTEITNAIIEGGLIYVKDFSGDWLDNTTGDIVQASLVPGEDAEQVDTVSPVDIILKDTNKALLSTGAGDTAVNNELWVKYSDGTEELLVVCHDEEVDVKDIIAGIFNPQLSKDKKKVYFMSEAWATSAAIHVVDIESKNQQFVCPGNYLRIIEKGQYSGDLIVNQHRYNDAPNYGSYDNYYIVDENGIQLEDLGDDPAVLDDY
ncbi:hypothetical protein [Clostridium estertheticum]|uniref:hypothetical protein n=1 Tax=Clostridium estertheticum TaxID=238834 RepID=UPI001C7DFAB6|nr:hypothetical protein [Clostridium estertheticum]MBX4267691.1 hypothetical protein [Clostridium estertheticum]WLC77940.1 hypothetical protein KTC98_11810 [Clostridium estertheticum]